MTKRAMVRQAGRDLVRELSLLERSLQSGNREKIDKHKDIIIAKLDIVYRSGLMDFERYTKILEELKKL